MPRRPKSLEILMQLPYRRSAEPSPTTRGPEDDAQGDRA